MCSHEFKFALLSTRTRKQAQPHREPLLRNGGLFLYLNVLYTHTDNNVTAGREVQLVGAHAAEATL
jgi:hypothetical protein